MGSSLTQKELAERLGISDRQVRKLAAKGMPTDSLESAKQWRSGRMDVSQSKEFRIDGNPGTRRGTEPEHRAESGTVEEQSIDLEITDADTLYWRSRAVKEKSLALQAKAEHDLFIGTLVKREDVERGVSNIVRQLRDGLVNVSRRIAAEAASLSDAAEVEKVIDREHRIMLEAMSRNFNEKFDKQGKQA
jgi:transcriptional regulator with XRE-family HTH domain